MARLSVIPQQVQTSNRNHTANVDIGTDPKQRGGFLLHDLTKKQQLREHTVYPPGQERYALAINKDDVESKLESIGGSDVTDSEVDSFLASTIGDGSGGSQSGDDISLSNINAAAKGDTSAISSNLSTQERKDLRNLVSFKFVETGKFKMSFDQGVIAELRSQNWVKVFTNAGGSLYTL